MGNMGTFPIGPIGLREKIKFTVENIVLFSKKEYNSFHLPLKNTIF